MTDETIERGKNDSVQNHKIKYIQLLVLQKEKTENQKKKNEIVMPLEFKKKITELFWEIC